MVHKCEKCGEEFDTERGLNIHQGRIHSSEEEPENKERSGTASTTETVEKRQMLELGIREVAFIFFILGAGIGFVSGVFVPLETGMAEKTASPSDEQELPIEEDTVTVSNINETDEPVMGKSNAPVTMVMYEDFQCPYCKSFEDNAFQSIESNYIESGQVKVVWKDFPLHEPPVNHEWADDSAAAMECVYRQDEEAFWEVKDKIFQNQRSLSEENVQSQIINWAENEGVSGSQVQSCIENGSPMKEVNRDKTEGSNLDATLNGQRFVAGTPSFVVYGDNEGTALSGALPYEAFKQVIEKELQDSQ
jgi:protein-disulfide isomerase